MSTLNAIYDRWGVPPESLSNPPRIPPHSPSPNPTRIPSEAPPKPFRIPSQAQSINPPPKSLAMVTSKDSDATNGDDDYD